MNDDFISSSMAKGMRSPMLCWPAVAGAQAGLPEEAWGLRCYPCRWPRKLPSHGGQVTTAETAQSRGSPRTAARAVFVNRGQPFSAVRRANPSARWCRTKSRILRPASPYRNYVTKHTLMTWVSGFIPAEATIVYELVLPVPTLPSKTGWIGGKDPPWLRFFS